MLCSMDTAESMEHRLEVCSCILPNCLDDVSHLFIFFHRLAQKTSVHVPSMSG